MVDFESRVWIIPDHKTVDRQQDPRPRIIPLPDCIYRMCHWIRQQPGCHKTRVFVNAWGRPYTKDRLVKCMARVRKRAGIELKAGEQIVLYSQRHSYITNAYGKVGDMALAELAGHRRGKHAVRNCRFRPRLWPFFEAPRSPAVCFTSASDGVGSASGLSVRCAPRELPQLAWVMRPAQQHGGNRRRSVAICTAVTLSGVVAIFGDFHHRLRIGHSQDCTVSRRQLDETDQPWSAAPLSDVCRTSELLASRELWRSIPPKQRARRRSKCRSQGGRSHVPKKTRISDRGLEK